MTTKPCSPRSPRSEDRQRQPSDADGRVGPQTAHFALTLVRGPAWNDSIGIRDQVSWADHASFMDDLVADGFILFGGPVGDGQQTLHVVAADGANDVRRRHAGDPWARAGLLKIGSIQSWELWLDFRMNTASATRSDTSGRERREPRGLPSGR